MKTKAKISDSLKVAGKMGGKIYSEPIIKHRKTEQRHLKKMSFSEKKIVVFLVDDDLFYLKTLQQAIATKHPSLTIKNFQSGEDCLKEIKQKPAVVILDYYLNSSNTANTLNGLDVLKAIKKASAKTKVIILSAQDSLDTAIKFIDNDSYDYIPKNESAFIKLNNILSDIIEEIELNDSVLKPYQIVVLIFIIALIIECII